MNKFSVSKVAEITGLSVSRIYKICKRADLGKVDPDLGLFVLDKKDIEFIKSRIGKRGNKL